MSYEKVPAELKALPQWVAFRMVDRENGHKGKVPVNPKTGENAKANDPATWGTFDDAETAVILYDLDGIGFEFANGYFGIDLDHVITKDGNISPKAADIVRIMDSYTEYSPSGSGLHILCRGSIPEGNRRKGNVEMYSEGRFFTVTGRPFQRVRNLEERTAAAAKVHAKYLQSEAARPQPAQAGKPFEPSESDAELLQKMYSSKRGEEIRRLFAGDLSGHNNDHSAADQALVNDLCYWTNGDAARIDKLFRSSGLMRPKWDERRGAKTYGQITINRALQGFKPYSVEAFKPVRLKNHPEIVPGAKVNPQPAADPAGQQAAPAFVLESISEYAATFEEFCTKQKPVISTGILDFDIALNGGLSDELYILGAETGQGKSAFSMHIAQNIAAAGVNVLYFALEMSKRELIARGISAITWEKQRKPITASAILYKQYDPIRKEFTTLAYSQYSEAAAEYFKRYGGNLFIIENSEEGITAARVNQIAKEFIKQTGKRCIVFVDYLQMIAADPADRAQQMNPKGKIDAAVRTLKNLSISQHIPVFAISSMNRQGYGKRVTAQSFKESGDVEYTGGVLLGLNLAAQVQDYKNQDDAEKAIKEALEANPRRMILEVLKYRNGKKNNDVYLNYYAPYNYFEKSLGVPARGSGDRPKI